MSKQYYQELRQFAQENSMLKQELLKALSEKEELILLSEELLRETEKWQRKYRNLSHSKLGRVTIWVWERRRKVRNEKRKL